MSWDAFHVFDCLHLSIMTPSVIKHLLLFYLVTFGKKQKGRPQTATIVLQTPEQAEAAAAHFKGIYIYVVTSLRLILLSTFLARTSNIEPLSPNPIHLSPYPIDLSPYPIDPSPYPIDPSPYPIVLPNPIDLSHGLSHIGINYETAPSRRLRGLEVAPPRYHSCAATKGRPAEEATGARECR